MTAIIIVVCVLIVIAAGYVAADLAARCCTRSGEVSGTTHPTSDVCHPASEES